MDLLQNPFHILTATPRDNRKKIMELADERNLLLDLSECRQAYAHLTHPRKRLAAELAWLPGVLPKHVNAVLRYLESSELTIAGTDKLMQFRNRFGVSKMTPIASANLLATGMTRVPDDSSGDVSKWILEIAWTFQKINPEEVRAVINEERVVSGFPLVTDTSAIEMEIKERRRHYRRVITSALSNLSVEERIKSVTIVVETSTDNGKNPGLILIDDLVDAYEVDAQEFLEKEERSIEVLDEKIRSEAEANSPDSALALMVNQLIQVVKNWDIFAQPIQINKKIQGLFHDASYRVAGRVRKLAVDLVNKYGKLDFSQQLTNMLQEVFAEVGEVAERIAEDAKALDEIAEQRLVLIETAKKRAEEWRREITYEAHIGNFFKKKLRISPEGIEWKGNRWNLDSITRIRWGGTRKIVYGIPTGTTYKIIFGNDSSYSSIELQEEAIYGDFIDRLWRAVGVRLLTEYLEGLRDEKKYRFGSAVIRDRGLELERARLFSSNERVFLRWSELVIWNGAGVFCIGKKGDKKLSVSFSYQDEDNIHVLEAAIRMFWKRGGDKLSNLLDE